MQNLRKFFAGVVDAFITLDAARAAAGAVEVDRPAQPRHLRQLGIDPKAFLSMGHG
ncbi:hypothetical protein [Amaricoccus sp.]|uniref:hypothetical protein n=1 Tax=Amaricoccus sp. TaxID=1872485 RepID=UPI001B4B595B|nr:hypothetical protein [Amaricoccus sp.]MBP7240517.1 hypothetical protein [Amaricoccus sp.]